MTYIHLILGGARSGKSRYAQALAETEPGDPVYVATAQALDGEMAGRILRHRADRGARWTTIEAPLDLAAALDGCRGQGEGAVLVDCLTLWASNLLLAEHNADQATAALLAAGAALGRPLILVANEVGLGIVPDNALARRFRDIAGAMNQRIAAAADQVTFVAAGLPLVLKGQILPGTNPSP
ncbi:bifunctional adenosylcobinamide kinase/adenosylcobinamide-phosphate guanylyltransferase [Sphingomonas quercus]|uniref:Bifunctional adenosylcobalamin biosynthesis protein n=1 Tax=Sphingomonas quercus TaxID=2842451 RepID=A0ABS6BK59_9SPHN|nr:bifunctional adenosylcobinamide kinase/adenosylcobinamide-phosphate guanylyltransferase [Sphingomonas quercus]MBU3078683.1 bifunctional adenosylcobinamide kinase/adenosylcobinamide-phosphate guanylyltransferase [Sphingomonas quercus]